MKVPFFDLTRQYKEIKAEVEADILSVMDSCLYIEGPKVKLLEQELQKYLNVKHVITCGNGTDALRIALQANGVKEGDEVITTSFSFFATAEAIAQIGAIPIFADIEEKSLNLSPKDVEDKITDKTKAILPVHIFGRPADMKALKRIADKYSLPLIEDACQAIGAKYYGQAAGTIGDIGCFSFYPTKNLGGFGDGGMITTNDDMLAEVCRAIKSHAAGRTGAKAYSHMYHKELPELHMIEKGKDSLYDPCKYYNYMIGGNSRLDSMQAAVLLVKLKRLDSYNQKRRKIAEFYSEHLKALPIELPEGDTENSISCWHQYAILCEDKEGMIQYLAERGIGAGNFYPIPLHLQKAFQNLNGKEGDLPISERVCKQSVCLPVFPELETDELEYIVKIITDFFRGTR